MREQGCSLGGQVLLARWAVVGVITFLCAPWILPNDKAYHQLVAVLLWLPALFSLGYAALRPRLSNPELLAYMVFAGWTLLVLAVSGGEEPLGDMKVVLYVTLSLLGVLLADRVDEISIERLLLWSALVGGVGAGLSWISFYCLEQRPFSSRLIAIGVWDTVIMGGHAVGALAVCGLALVLGRPWQRVWIMPAGLAVLGYLAFLIFSQTRGIWLALLASLIVVLTATPWRVRLVTLLGLSLAVIAVVLYDAQLLMQRGFSYRPVLWSSGLQLIAENPWLGLGFHEFLLTVPELKIQFKHPHNLFLDTGVRLGVIGLLLFCGLWLLTFWRAWQARSGTLGLALLALWVFSTVSLMTDGIGLWRKPNADWLIMWLPVAMGMVLGQRLRASGSQSELRS